MSGSGDNGVTTALATIGTVCWCIQLIPQIVRNWYVRDCEGVPPIMFFLFAACGTPFAIYFLDQDANTALIVQPHLFQFFSFVGFWQSLYYRPVSYSPLKSTVILALCAAACAGIEVGCVIPLRHLYRKGTHWPNLIPGIIAAVLLAAGLLPPYWELFKRKGRVVGINFLFLILDSSGAVFSTASVAVDDTDKVDVLGIILYVVVLVLELGIMSSHAIWVIRVRYFGLAVEDVEAVELHQALKKEGENPPVSDPLRSLVRDYIVRPIARQVLRLRKDLRILPPAAEDSELQASKSSKSVAA